MRLNGGMIGLEEGEYELKIILCHFYMTFSGAQKIIVFKW